MRWIRERKGFLGSLWYIRGVIEIRRHEGRWSGALGGLQSECAVAAGTGADGLFGATYVYAGHHTLQRLCAL